MKNLNNYFSSCKRLVAILVLTSGSLMSSAQKIAAGGHSLAICTDSTQAQSWGYNFFGQLGDGTKKDTSNPVNVLGLKGITAVAAGSQHSIFLKDDGTVWTCGVNGSGDRLGDGTTKDRTTPVQVTGLTGIIKIAAGGSHSIFLKDNGEVWACGWNFYGQLGDGTTKDRNTPVKVAGLTNIIAVAAGNDHSIFLKKDGTVLACGSIGFGQLGNGKADTLAPPFTQGESSPVEVMGLKDIIAISAGSHHSLFLEKTGIVWACGNNTHGQLGDGTTEDKNTPEAILRVFNIIDVAAGGSHSLLLQKDGIVLACGWNHFGQLGDGTTGLDRRSPVEVKGLNDITGIAAGSSHSLFLKKDAIWACGDNKKGELGDGTKTQQNTPVQVKEFCKGPAPVPEDSVYVDTTFTETPPPSDTSFTDVSSGDITFHPSAARYSAAAIAEERKLSVQILPNPSVGNFIIKFNEILSVNTEFKIHNIFGAEVFFESKAVSGQCDIDLSSQPTGIYFLNINTGGKTFNEKIIISR